VSAFAAALAAVRAGDKSADEAADELFEQLTERERRWLLDGDTPVWPGLLSMVKQYNVEPIVAGAVERLGIPGIRFTDGPRGVVMGASTCFPVPIARAATFDVTLEEEVGRAIGAEARAQGANFFGGVCVNLTRHPAWGRAQESYGEDPVLLGAMGAALTRGVRENVMACVKHFALNSMEDARFYVDVEVDDDVLHDVYLPHFRRVIEAGADAVMSAYNRVNGTWCGEHRGLLTEVLRERWGFEGVVISDFVWGLRDPVRSLAAGLDVEMPFRQQRARAKLPAEDIARSARRILATQLQHAAKIGPTPTVEIAGPEHRALARRAAARGCVLLENDGLLPLTAESIAVVGPLAQTANTGDIGSSRVRPPSTASVLDGLKAALPGARVRLTDAAGAANHDVAVVVVGYTAKEEGEAFIETDPDMIGHLGLPIRTALGRRVVSRVVRTVGRWLHPGGGDRRSLRLPAEQEALIERVTKANPNTVVVVITGGAVVMPWRKTPRALVVAWYPGMEGGHAIADVLLGRSSPGRLPVAFPEREEDLGPFERTARRVRYDRWWGQRRLDRDGCAAAYPFGYGLGFTTFVVQAAERDGAEVHVTVVNTGARRGTTVVQLYTTPIRALVDFAVVELDPAGARTVTFATKEDALEAALHHGDPAAVAVQL
jgi:beta-glucosidase